ncbi:MAG: MliC family protein [Amaricoccus sp.]|uniref:MliC family protein n=1 Tax=Amaricoccus sp. TaxID=1872485 RepID=UPI0033146777
MRLISLLALLAAPAPALADDVTPALTATYVCAGGAVLRVAYLNPSPDDSLAVVDYGGRLIPMRAGPTGSGVRYVAFDPVPGFVWHGKGPDGTLFTDGENGQRAILEDCHQVGS